LAHNSELLRQYYFATTIGKANQLLAELIKADPANETEYRATLAEAKKDWDALSSKERIERYEKPAEAWIQELIRNTPDANGEVRGDYVYSERNEPSVADIASAIARPVGSGFLADNNGTGQYGFDPYNNGTGSTMSDAIVVPGEEGFELAQANNTDPEPVKNERGEFDSITIAINLNSKIKSLNDKEKFKKFKDEIQYEPDRSRIGRELGLTIEELQNLENKNRKNTITYLQEKLNNLIKEKNLMQIQESGISELDQIRNSMKDSFKLGKLEDGKASFKAIRDANPDIDLNKLQPGDILQIPTLEQYKKAYKEMYKEEYNTQTKAEAARVEVIKSNLKKDEGFQSRLYMDYRGNTSVGYGHTPNLEPLFVSDAVIEENKNKLTKKEIALAKKALSEIRNPSISANERYRIASSLPIKIQNAIYTPIDEFPTTIIPGTTVSYRDLHPLSGKTLKEEDAILIAGKDLDNKINLLKAYLKPGKAMDYLNENFSQEQISSIYNFIFWSGGVPESENYPEKAAWTKSLYKALEEPDSKKRLEYLTKLFRSIEVSGYIQSERIDKWRAAFGIR
jgi:hypothetical protein